MKKLLCSSALLAALAMPAMAQDYTPDPAATPGGMITVTYKDDVATLDPAIGYDWQNWSMIKSLFDGLMDYEPGTTNLRPELAESYEISPDGKTFTFKLRHGVKFHNGREMTADDVKYSLDRVTNPKTQSPGAGFFASIGSSVAGSVVAGVAGAGLGAGAEAQPANIPPPSASAAANHLVVSNSPSCQRRRTSTYPPPQRTRCQPRPPSGRTCNRVARAAGAA